MAQKFSDVARSQLAAGIDDSATTLTMDDGSQFPSANVGSGALDSGDWFKAVLDNGERVEIVYVRTHTSGSATFSDILRGQEGTTARAWDQGDVVGLRLTAADAVNFAGKLPAGTTPADIGAATAAQGALADTAVQPGGLPTKLSDLSDDLGVITSETDPTVPGWAKTPNKPAYTAAEVGAVPTSRKVAGKALTGDITIALEDISGVPSVIAAGSTAAQARAAIGAVADSDPRLSDTRTPKAHQHSASEISDSTTVGRNVLTAADASAARTAIGAGTSNLTLGTTAGTALEGNTSIPSAGDVAKGVTAHGWGDHRQAGYLTQHQDISGKANVGASYTKVEADSRFAKPGDIPSLAGYAKTSDLGTAAAKDVPPSGNASAGQVVMGNDTRLTNSRTPTAHTHTAANISDSTVVGRSVLTAANAAAARSAIGAGTSNLALGSTSSTAMPGNTAIPSYSEITEANLKGTGSTVGLISGRRFKAAFDDRVDTSGSLGSSDAKVPSQKATKTYVDNAVAALGVPVFVYSSENDADTNLPEGAVGIVVEA